MGPHVKVTEAFKEANCLIPLGFNRLCSGVKNKPETHNPLCIHYKKD